MAKVKPGIIHISGKLGDKVFVDNVYGEHVRETTDKGNKDEEPALKKQYSRTSLLNDLASELNTLISLYAKEMKPSGFYHSVQSRFRNEPLNNRVLLLWKLRGMDINSTYSLNKMGSRAVTVSEQKKHIAVNLQVLGHPPAGKYHANCHCCEIILLSWNKRMQPATHNRQYSDWIDLAGGLPEFEFLFPKPAGTIHWLVCLRQQLGKNRKAIEPFVATGMQIVDVGSFDKAEAAILEQKLADENIRVLPVNEHKPVADVPRVKAKRVV